MTPNQLRAVVYKIARTYLEVERGLRSTDQLSAFLTQAEYRRHRVTRGSRRAASRPVRAIDIGKVRLDAATPDRVKASVLVRRDDDRWSSLLVDLKQTGHGWQVERLDRLERLLPREPRQVEIDEDAVERRRRFVESERRSVESVYRSVAKRYEGIPDKRTKPARALRPELDRWGERVAAIDDELEALGPATMCPTQDAAGRGLSEARSSVDDALGGQHPPAEVEPLVARYRERWNLAPDEPLIGTSLAGAQAEERRDLLKAVRGLVRAGADDLTLSQSLGGLGVDL